MSSEHHSYSVSMNPSPAEGELSVLFSGEAQPMGLHKIGPAIHDYYLVHTVLSGRGEFIIRDTSYPCVAGDTFVIFPGELFSYQADEREPWSYVWVGFIGRGADDVMSQVGATPHHPVIPGSLNPNIRSYYDKLIGCYDSAALPELANLEAGGWIRLLLQQFGVARKKLEKNHPESTAAIDLVIKQAIQYLTLQYTQPISIEHLSGMLGYHRTHLCKLFKQSTGLSPSQYLLNIRMQRAESLLASSMTIEQVASSVGFGDALYFSKKFRKWRGQSPTEYRKALRTPPKRSKDPYRLN
ncbi:helix-turn-helix transcriptional regulator [Cohnella herbarum]|uniref:AraC family transcriptional regulator n=1 Tax=Cohnella herbarum TaxID=2728023 RepID=A0A7Z2VPY4_9BACL|nr:AraC family transcriptional regulator [Cohnella herbarum]QJD86987.1 AraC family transcriptional regulator [Cohnella herbarum]